MSKYIKPKANYNVSGMSLNDIVNMDFDTVERLSRNDLARLTSRLTSAGNKRLKTLKKSSMGQSSQALKGIENAGRVKFSVKGKSHGQLLKEFASAKSFLKAKTSTIKGTKEVVKRTRKTLKEKYDIDTEEMSKTDIAKMWDNFHKMQEKGSIGGRGSLSSELAVKTMGRLQNENVLPMSQKKFESAILDGMEETYEDYEDEDEEDMFDDFEEYF